MVTKQESIIWTTSDTPNQANERREEEMKRREKKQERRRRRMMEDMKKRLLVALASSLVLNAALLLLLLPVSTSPSLLLLLLPPRFSPPKSLLHLLLHLFSSSSSQIIAAIASSSSSPDRKRKRKRKHPDKSESAVLRSPDHFRLCFRMSSSSFEYLSGLLEPLLDCGPDLRPTSRLAIALFRLATGCPYPDLASRFLISEPTARSCTKRLCRVLCTNFRFWLTFPPNLPSSSAAAAIPNCCGAILSTSFHVSRDGGRAAAIIVQVVSDSSCRILNVAAGHRGGLQSSSLYRDVQAGKLFHCSSYLVGDKGFPLLPWLMVPFDDPLPLSKEDDFNAAHAALLRPGLRTLKSLRNWGVLTGPMVDEDRKMAVACIATCAMLHNALLMRDDHSALSSSEDHEGAICALNNDNRNNNSSSSSSSNNSSNNNNNGDDNCEIESRRHHHVRGIVVDSKVDKEASKVRMVLADTARELRISRAGSHNL